jgi:ABC-type nitrate/sulfonate/bicarbonate transport system ATPase subunit
MPQIRAEQVEKRFGEVQALSRLNLGVERNEFVSVLGPSGCGKTTLLRIVAGLIPPDGGAVYVDDEPVTAPRLNMTLVFQNFRLLPWQTVEDNVGYGLRVRGTSRKQARQEVDPFIRMVGLEGFEHAYPYQLSGGMQQRVGLARALAIDPQILLMDEPFGALDAQTREVMQEELLRIWNATQKTVVFVTHSIDEALVLSDRVVMMAARPGRIIENIDVPFPRPRDPVHLRAEPRFTELRTRMWELLRGTEPEQMEAASG